MNKREREAVTGFIEAFTHLQPSAAIRFQIAETFRRFTSSSTVQIIDFKGHLEPQRGPETIATSSNDVHRYMIHEYSQYLPEHAMIRPHIWNRLVRERVNSVATIGERSGLEDWRKCGFKEKFLRRMEVHDVGGIHLLGPHGTAQFGVYLPIYARNKFDARRRQFYTFLAPYLSDGLSNLMHWDAQGREQKAAAAGLEHIDEALAVIRNRKLLAASSQAQDLLGLAVQRTTTNAKLAEFLRLAPFASVYGQKVHWTSAEGMKYQLLTMKMPDGSLIVKFRLPTATNSMSAAASAALTERQAQVMRHVSSGLGDKQIAAEMNISAATVRAHLRAIYSALNVNGRIEAANAVRSHYDE